MRTFIPEITTLLNTQLEGIQVKAYLDVVPESVPLPQVSFSNPIKTRGRTLNKKRTKTKLTWRVSIVGASMADMQPILDKLDDLDGTSNEHFQDIELVSSRVEPKPSDGVVRRVLVDFNATER